MTRAAEVSNTPTRLVSRALAFLLIAVTVAGCDDSDTSIATPLPTEAPAVAADVLAARGEIVEQQILTDFFEDSDHVIGQAQRAVYRSVSGVDGGSREVSGVFLVPRGDPPRGGWPVVSLAHGTTGIGNDCGPSRDHTLMGFLPAVKAYLADGYAIAVSDYEGLGEPGQHPYLEPRTSAFNITDAVRALRNVFPDVSTRWAALGNSQGGQAVWAANELAAGYGTGLDFVGAVALSPAANVTELADLAYTHSLTAEQRAVAPLVVEGVERYTPGLADHALLPAVTPAEEIEMFSCVPDAGALRDKLLPHDGVHLEDQDTTALLREALRRVALPQGPLSAPLLVINGLADQTIPPQWVAVAVEGACELWAQIEHFEVRGAGHSDLGERAYDTTSAWIRDRFASLPAPSNCGAAPGIL